MRQATKEELKEMMDEGMDCEAVIHENDILSIRVSIQPKGIAIAAEVNPMIREYVEEVYGGKLDMVDDLLDGTVKDITKILSEFAVSFDEILSKKKEN